MRKTYIFILFIFLPAAFLNIGCSQKLLNLDDEKDALMEYYEKGAYDREASEAVEKAISKLEKMEIPPKAAAVFDVDETSLSSYDYVKSIGFGYVPKLWNDYLDSSTMKAIPQTKKLYDKLVEKGVAVIFLTGRKEIFFEATVRNLKNEGYTKFDTLITRSKEEYGTTAVEFKSRIRRRLAENGYNIILNAGDQYSDLEGGNSGIEVKLPNYLYLVK
jgi:acid phosphatase